MISRTCVLIEVSIVVAVLAVGLGCSKSTTEQTAAPALSTVSVSPSSGSGTSGTFTATFSDAKGAGNISLAGVLINSVADGVKSCYLMYVPPANALSLVKDSGAGSNAVDLAKGGIVANSQCTLNAAGSSVSSSGNELVLKLNLTFDNSYKGAKHIYLYAEDKDGQKIGLQTPLAAWTVQ
jgi:hypothetical protein